jgi:hypothetical protein
MPFLPRASRGFAAISCQFQYPAGPELTGRGPREPGLSTSFHWAVHILSDLEVSSKSGLRMCGGAILMPDRSSDPRSRVRSVIQELGQLRNVTRIFEGVEIDV